MRRRLIGIHLIGQVVLKVSDISEPPLWSPINVRVLAFINKWIGEEVVNELMITGLFSPTMCVHCIRVHTS